MSAASRRLGRRRPITRPISRPACPAGALPARPAGEAVHGTAARVGVRDGLGPVEHQHGAGLDHHARQARPPRPARWCAGRSPACRRAAPGRAWGLWPARRAARRPRRGRAGPPPAAAWRRCPRRPRWPAPGRCATTTAWPASTAPERRRTAKPSSASARSCRRQRDAADAAGAGQQVGRHLVHAAHLEALALEEAHDAREHGIVAARQQAEDLRQAPEEAGVGPDAPQVGPRHGAGDHQLSAAFAAQRRHHAADLAPVDPGVREAGDRRVGLALDADDVHASAARRHALGDHQRQPPSAGQDADARLASPIEVPGGATRRSRASPRRWSRPRHASGWGTHSERLPPARMKATISLTIGWPSNSSSTSSRRSSSVPSSANSRR